MGNRKLAVATQREKEAALQAERAHQLALAAAGATHIGAVPQVAAVQPQPKAAPSARMVAYEATVGQSGRKSEVPMKAATDTLTSRIEKSREKPLTEEEAEEAYLKRFEFPIPIGIEFTRMDIHTGGPPANPDSVLAVATRGAIPKVAISAEVEGSTEGITGRP